MMKEDIVNLLLTYQERELLDERVEIAKKINSKIKELKLKDSELIFSYLKNGQNSYFEIYRDEEPLKRDNRNIKNKNYTFINILREY